MNKMKLLLIVTSFIAMTGGFIGGMYLKTTVNANESVELCGKSKIDQLKTNMAPRQGSATIINKSKNCTFKVGVASHTMFKETKRQWLYDGKTTLVKAGESVHLKVNVPNCRYQFDVFVGEPLQTLIPGTDNNSTGYKSQGRLIDGKQVEEGLPWCKKDTPEPTNTPTPTNPANPTPTQTATPTPTNSQPTATPTPTTAVINQTQSQNQTVNVTVEDDDKTIVEDHTVHQEVKGATTTPSTGAGVVSLIGLLTTGIAGVITRRRINK
jgi:hypothetical protein